MKNVVFSVILLFISTLSFSQDAFIANDPIENSSFATSILELNDKYEIISTGINTPLSDIGATFFMNKYIMYSSRKTGAIGAGRDANTGNPYSSLYCLNIDKTGNLSHPYFFASVLDEKGNEGGITFPPIKKQYITPIAPLKTVPIINYIKLLLMKLVVAAMLGLKKKLLYLMMSIIL